MRDLHLRSLLVAVVVLGTSVAAQAQQLPSQAQAQQMLQNPALVEQLRQKIITSGMTDDQIRARLQAMGYPPHMLDAYLPGNPGTGSSQANSNTYSAVNDLGLTDSTDLEALRCNMQVDSLMAADTVMLTRADSNANQRRQAKGRNPRIDSTRFLIRREELRRKCQRQADSLRSPEVIGRARSDSGFNIFGLDVFRSGTTQFDPNTTGPVDAGYRFGPGDRIVLVLTGDVEESYALDVTREGFIVIPQVGQVYVNNLTLGQVEDLLYTRLGRVYSGVRRGPDATTHFSVSPAKLRSNLIYVVGDVLKPGAYQVSSAGTLFTALLAAGGPSDEGSLRAIQVRRNGQTVETMDVYDYLINGDASHDVRLQNGDIVFVPEHLARVRMAGEVVRPATYELKPTETLADAMRFAGGFRETASRRRVQIERILAPKDRVDGRDRITTDVTSDALETGYGPAVPMSPGDIVHVFPVTTHVRNQIYVRGDVYSPGTLGLSPGMKLSEALKMAGGVKPDVYLGNVLISRMQSDSTRIQLRAQLQDTTGAVVNDLALQENDEIQVFSVSEFRPEHYVAISGAVQHPGQYPYREGMTMRDLVLMAGGLRQSAYLDDARVARLPETRNGNRTATEFSVPLDSSYLFDRSPDGKYLGPPGLPATRGPSPEVVLKPYDNVLILRQPNWDLQRTVTLAGEVQFPGKYTLVNKNERITDIIKRAGGLTPEAYANGVTFYRSANNVGRIGIDLSDVLENSHDRDNLLLQNGDSIYIPRFNSVILVEGAVNSPVGVTYVPGKNLNYYIRAAGGPTASANAKAAYVRQPNGKVDAEQRRFLIPDYVPEPKPGSTVIVPERDPGARSIDPFTIVGALGGVLSSLVAIAVALRR